MLTVYRGIAAIVAVSLIGFGRLSHLLLAKRARRLMLAILPLGLLTGAAAMKLALGPRHGAFEWLVKEDGIFEWTTFAAYGCAAIVAARVAVAAWRQRALVASALWGALCIAMAFVSFEEISWGQRVLGIQTPAAFEDNIQRETTLHNMPTVQQRLHAAYAVVGFLGASAWMLQRQARRVGWLRSLLFWIAPARGLMAYFAPIAIFYGLILPTRSVIGPDGLRFGFFSVPDQELFEMLLSFGFLVFAADRLSAARHQPAGQAAVNGPRILRVLRNP
jgi:hypothetical protein